MKVVKNRCKIIYAMVLSVCLLAGCGAKNMSHHIKNDGTVKYSTSVAMSAADYASYVNTQSMTIINQLSTRADIGLKVSKNQYPLADEMKNVESSLVIVEDAIENLTVTNPPAAFLDTREDILRCMANTKSSLEAYKEALIEKDATKIKSAISMMKSDASALTAYVNLSYN